MKKCLICLIITAMICIFSAAFADDYPFLGKTFPEFETTDTNRNLFSLSEALKSHEAVLINLWTSWCGPCIREFPLLNDVYAQYGDQVAFIGMTVDPEDTWNTLFMMEKQYGMTYPVAKEAGTGILDFIGGSLGTPTTIIVDRFGKVVFVQAGAFSDSASLSRVLDVFLGNQYSESVTLTGIPMPAKTQALPVSSSRRMWVENENARRILLRFHQEDPELSASIGDEWVEGWLIPGKSALLSMELGAGDNLTDIVFSDYNHDRFYEPFSLLDSDRNVYTYDLSMEKQSLKDTWCWVSLGTKSGNLDLDPFYIEMCLFPDEDSVRELVSFYREENVTVTWEYAEKSEQETEPQEVYILHTIDQFGDTVPGVMVSFCTDLACSATISDENGIITFNGESEDYHVQILKTPDGYRFDPEFELRTGACFGEWILIIRRD